MAITRYNKILHTWKKLKTKQNKTKKNEVKRKQRKDIYCAGKQKNMKS